ncbi:MAG: hypothetical protein PF961_22465 [Planctomycetota bacterium]|jgi:very-short-patch-repair endonuclease|nr:hypothetical protein [Planctomycetota bacterium]
MDRGKDLKADPDSPFEVEVARVIRSLGLDVRYQIGVAKYRIDLAIINPAATGEYLMGIECDGATYHSSRCARDRDRLRESVLRSRGWSIYRIWSTDWFQNRVVEIERLREAIKERLANPGPQFPEPEPPPQPAKAPPQASASEPAKSSSQASLPATPRPATPSAPSSAVRQEQAVALAPDLVQPYAAFEGGPFPDPRAASREIIADGLRQIVAVEGPMIIRRSYDVYLRAAGIRRMGKEIRKLMNRAMYLAVQSKQIEVHDELDTGGYMRATARIPGTQAVRLRDLGPRTIDDIPPSELCVVSAAILTQDPAINSGADEHLRAILAHYGLKQLTQHTREVLTAVIAA